jgi:hypothetical protein
MMCWPPMPTAPVAVYLVDARDAGHAMIDRELYVPRGWIEDPDRCRLHPPGRRRPRHPPSPGLISLTCNQVQHLLATLLARPAEDLSHRLAWSVWRRRHQARARTCHYQRQANQP